VTWFGTEDRCWVCGRRGDGPVTAVPPNGSETWSAARCADTADAEETAAFVRRVITA
jgi:ribosome-binding protein aMBF1 (putative translation factor)